MHGPSRSQFLRVLQLPSTGRVQHQRVRLHVRAARRGPSADGVAAGLPLHVHDHRRDGVPPHGFLTSGRALWWTFQPQLLQGN